MRTTIGIDAQAPADLVFELARDPLRWPALLPHYVRARALSRTDSRQICQFVARRPLVDVLGFGLPVAWVSRTWAEPETLRLRFQHLAGATRGMDVTWHIEPTPTGCRITIEHDFRPRIGAWALVVDRAFTRPIAGRTLRTFKALAEAVAERAPDRGSTDR
jgi:ribosome-associated toxin RatA of RatAB toxin-antitoxin module